MKPGIYDMSLADYLADPCPSPSLSTGIVQAMIERTPTHAYRDHPQLGSRVRKPSRRADFGSVAHAAWLGGEALHVIQAKDPRGDRARDYKTKAARQERDGAKASGKIPILAHEKEKVDDMMCELDIYRDHMEIEGKPERTIVWEEQGVWLRSRPDLTIDPLLQAWDYKTATNADPISWTKTAAIPGGYDIKAALILRGLRAVTGKDWSCIFLVQETEEPYACNSIGAGATLLELASRKIDRAIEIWRRCLERDEWPRYGYQVVWAEAPNYHRYEVEAREEIWRAGQ